jgi:hypothetical protein
MGFVLADQNGWLAPWKSAFEPVVLNTFDKLRAGVTDGTADFFMWEHFTSKRYYDNGEIKRIGEIYTPWSSWKIVAKPETTHERLAEIFGKIDQGIQHFHKEPDEAVSYISTELDYSKEDAVEWLKTVRFSKSVRGVDPTVIGTTIETLGKAGVLEASSCNALDMIGIEREYEVTS